MLDALPADPPSRLAAPAAPAAGWFASPARRAAAAALITELRAQLRATHSATAVLDRWCVVHHLAPGHAIVADKLAEGEGEAPAAVRRRLQVAPAEPLSYRHVRLRCRGHLLSEAELWFVPSRLPAEMNERLRLTDTPFGQAIAALAYRRIALGGRRLWTEASGVAVPADLFDETALLVLPDGSPLAFVREVYKSGLLPPP